MSVNITSNGLLSSSNPGGTDELAWAIGTSLGPYIHLLHVGGLVGGLVQANSDIIIDLIKEYDVKHIRVESNMGHGLFEINLRKALDDAGVKDVSVEGEYAKGQKESRIVNSLVTVLQRHRFVVHQSAIDSDKEFCERHTSDVASRSLFYQMENITLDRQSLVRDDRVEAVAGLVRMYQHDLALNEEAEKKKREALAAEEFVRNPMGYDDMKTTRRGRGTSRRLKYGSRNI